MIRNIFQAVSCFRSTGSMPVAKPVTMIIPNYLPHKDRNKKKVAEEKVKKTQEVVIKHATLETLEELAEDTTVTIDKLDTTAEEPEASVVEKQSLKVIKSPAVQILTCEPEKPRKSEQRCKKHSRCHCDLLSLETSDFFTIKV